MEDDKETWTMTVRNSAVSAWAAGDAELAAALKERLVVAFLGSASSGKDSGIRALFGLDFGEVSPIPGSTSTLRVAELDPEGRVLLLNAPGFGDVRREVDSAVRRALDSLDVVVFVVNCEGGATADERRDLDLVRRMGRPVLVCLNKIDLIRTREREAFVAATLAQLGVDPKDAVVTAFDPLPQLAPGPIGVEPVINWIGEQLAASGKGLLFAKQLRNKAAACEPLIRSAARAAAVAGAVPIPGVDLAAITAIQVKLIRDIAAVHGQSLDQDVVMFILTELMAGGMRSVARWGLEALKAAGWIPGGQLAEGFILAISGTIAGASTYGVGRATIAWLQSGRQLGADALRGVFDGAADSWKRDSGQGG